LLLVHSPALNNFIIDAKNNGHNGFLFVILS
jgi:hypothetical protein